MKAKFYIWMMLGAITVAGAMTGCNKGDDEDGNKNGNLVDNTITAVVENGNTYNTTVNKVWGMMLDYTTDPWQAASVVTVDYTNGGFVIELPATVHSKYLEAFDDAGFDDGITISNPKVATGTINFDGYKSDSEAPTGYSYVGDFIYCNYNPNSDSEPTAASTVAYLYADGDVSITGTATHDKGSNEWTRISNYNLSLKKGWNVIYVLDTIDESTKTGTSTYNHTAPAGLKWQFAPNKRPTGKSFSKHLVPPTFD